MLTEAVAASAAIMLEQDTLAGMRQMLEFIVNRDTSLERITLHRERDNSRRVFVTDPTPDGTSARQRRARLPEPARPRVLIVDALQLPSRWSAQVAVMLRTCPALQCSHRALSAERAKAESPTDSAESTDASLISVPLMRGGRPWGHLILDFVDATNGSPLTWIRQSPFGQILFIGLLSFPLFYLYLGKMLNQLNPSTAVPGRVRSALDTIAESLLVIDAKYNIVLANTAFAELTNREADSLLGVQVGSLPWITVDEPPWKRALESGDAIRQDMIGFTDRAGKQRKFHRQLLAGTRPEGSPRWRADQHG